MQIVFPSIETQGEGGSVFFPADVDGKRIPCSISAEALHDNFGGDDQTPLECFRINRARIVAKAAKLIENERFESDGRIFIRTSDGG